ncbi:MAG: hypothetical protein ACUZ8N_09625 [Candidatus Scalindua sp.]
MIILAKPGKTGTAVPVFPNEIRYGEILKHFPVSVMAKLSRKIVTWVQLHWDDIQD